MTEIKMDAKTDLSQFHHCDNCEGGTKKVIETTQSVDAIFANKDLSPREGMQVLLSAVCELAAAQESPDAAIEQAAATLKKLFESGKDNDDRRKKPAYNPNVH